MTLNRIASIAQNSIRQSQEKAAPLFNDSLDHMKRDFMNQFNRLMETEVPPSVDKNGASARNMSPINRQAFGSNSFSDHGNNGNRALILEKEITIKQLQLENAELKEIVESLTTDMNTVML